VSSDQQDVTAEALNEYGMAVGRAVRQAYDPHVNAWNSDDYLAAIVASVKPPEQRYPPIANDQDKRLMLETLEFALRSPGGPEKLYQLLRDELGEPPSAPSPADAQREG